MIIRNFEYLLALAKEKHFSRAAAACHVSQPTLSGGIKQLEQDMDVRIVKRGRTFEGFTTEGERVLAWAQQMMDDCQRLKSELRTFRESSMQGSFRIGVLPATATLGSTLSVPFAEQFPGLSLSVSTATATDLLNMVRAGEMDVAITYIDEAPGDGLATHSLYREQMFYFTTETIVSGKKSEIPPTPLCLLKDSLPAPLIAALEGTRKILSTDSATVMAAHVRTGKWSTILPQSLVDLLTSMPQMYASPIRKKPGSQANVGFITTSHIPLSASVHALMEMAHSPGMVHQIRTMLESYQRYLPTAAKRNNSETTSIPRKHIRQQN